MSNKINVVRYGQENEQTPFHYTASGLDNVYLLGGYLLEKTSYGDAVTINNIKELHQAIGIHLIGLPRPLSSKEFRFLRKEIGASQQKFGDMLGGLDGQTIARYEKGETAINGSSERLSRMVYAMNLMDRNDLQEMVQSIKDAFDSKLNEDEAGIYLNETSDGWLEQVS